MNYLALVKRAISEAGASGVNNVTTVANASGELLRFTQWINQAWIDIQNKRSDWLFMRKSVQFNLIANQAEYSVTSAPIALTDYGSWIVESFRIYKDTISNELRLWYLDYIPFRDTYLLNTTRTSYSQPNVVTVSPSKSLIFALPPDYAYTVLGDYQRTATNLVADTDIPDLPERFHMMLVYGALKHYGAYESYPEKFTFAMEEYVRLNRQMEIDQLPGLLRNGRF